MTQSREAAEANSFAEAFEASLNFKTPEQGELLRGQIVSISGDDAFVSYGGPSEAVMAAAELDGLDVGDLVEGTVIQTTPEIRPLWSHNMRLSQRAVASQIRTV